MASRMSSSRSWFSTMTRGSSGPCKCRTITHSSPNWCRANRSCSISRCAWSFGRSRRAIAMIRRLATRCRKRVSMPSRYRCWLRLAVGHKGVAVRTVIRFYLWWQRAEIVLVALLVPGLIVESSIANGWVYAGGVLSASLPAVIGLLRGFFFETLTYVTARQAFILRRKQHWFGCGLMGLVSLVAIYVSAANNLGWVMAGHDLAGLFGTLGQVMGDGPLLHGYEFFLAVLLPVSVGAVALVPLDHFFQHAIEQDHLDNHALQVDERHMHRSAFLKAKRKQRKLIEQAYQNIAE